MKLCCMQDSLEKTRKHISKDGTLHSPGAKEADKKCQELMKKLLQMAQSREEEEWVKR